MSHGGSVLVPASLWRAFLRAPLVVKLLGANLLIVIGAFSAYGATDSLAWRLGLAVVLSFTATSLLVWIALRPIAQLQDLAERVSGGDWRARASESYIADAGVARLAATLNRLLDRVQSDRARIEYLAGRSVRARDTEREAVARELRDSLAQMVSAIGLGLAAARNATSGAMAQKQIEDTRRLVQDLTEQMQGVAETLYPGTIGEFGLPNAMKALGRVTTRRSGIEFDIDVEAFDKPLARATAAALYRVADEAMRNIAQHSGARQAVLVLTSDEGGASLEVVDDGRGVDVRVNDPLQAGLGLFSARAVLALVGGELQISGAPGRGTRVSARVPAAAH